MMIFNKASNTHCGPSNWGQMMPMHFAARPISLASYADSDEVARV